MFTIIYEFYYLINIFMVQFSFTPQQFYTRTPQSNQTPVNSFYNGLQQNNFGNGGYYQDIAGLSGFNPYNTIPGTVGYRLPAQNYVNYGINHPATYGTQSLKTALVNTAINAGVSALVNAFTGGNDPSSSRLYGTGISEGATPDQLLPTVGNGSDTAFKDDDEDRVFIRDQTGIFINSAIMRPLQALGGVLFPYTPQITVGHKANYESVNLVHTNYTVPQFQHSSVDNIGISAQFTANYPAEAEYMLAMIHFFRSVTKMFYGKDQRAGTPPPVLYLDGYGPYTFDHIPVVITAFDYTLPTDVDYISCKTVYGEKQKVPTSLNITLSMIPTYSRNKISNEFGLSDFANGILVSGTKSSARPRTGGWI